LLKKKRNLASGRSTTPKVDESASYLFSVEGFSPSYSFSAGSHWQNTAHDEHLTAKVTARCLAPKKYSGRVTTFTLLGDRTDVRLMNAESSTFKAAVVGTLTLRGKHSEYLGGLPFDALLNLQSMFVANKIKFIWLAGAQLKHGSATIARISFDVDIEDADMHLLERT
jgi:hypothetical protein